MSSSVPDHERRGRHRQTRFVAAPQDDCPSQQNDVSVFERQLIERALRDTDGNKSKTARRLGLTRTQLYGRLRRYGLQAPVVVAALS
jgi:DNA-binding NtrC family response regulator